MNVRVGVGGVFVPFVRRAGRPQRDHDRRYRLAPPHRREPAARPGRGRPLPKPRRPPVPDRGDVRTRVPASAQSYLDDDEASWVNEGLSMYAERSPATSTSASRSPTSASAAASSASSATRRSRPREPEPDPPVGRRTRSPSGATRATSEIVCDYGAAETFMHYLAGRFGPGSSPRSTAIPTTVSSRCASSLRRRGQRRDRRASTTGRP